MTNSEFTGEDPMELHVRDAELFINMTDERIRELAADPEFGMSEDEIRQWRQKKIADYRSVDTSELDDDQYRRLFGRDREPIPPTLLTGMTEARWRNLTDEERDEAAADLAMSRDVLDASFEDLARDWAWLEELHR